LPEQVPAGDERVAGERGPAVGVRLRRRLEAGVLFGVLDQGQDVRGAATNLDGGGDDDVFHDGCPFLSVVFLSFTRPT